MRIGKLNRRVSLQQPTEVRDELGQPMPGWSELARPWAYVRYLNGKEYATSGTEVSGATASVRIRYRQDVTASMRIVHGSTILNVLAVLPDEGDREYIDLACNTGANDG
ncbi:SPP1 family predicted phage head-tail adaptor [Paraburkholderia sp. JPY465]|uniref:phage head closure protein n=1 Tax=Paraburkholderia sp. JPY465 TaxID=3042285 RepID=UPI003D258122